MTHTPLLAENNDHSYTPFMGAIHNYLQPRKIGTWVINATKSVVYIFGCGFTISAIARFLNPDETLPYLEALIKIHLAALPPTALYTYVLLRLSGEDTSWLLPSTRESQQALLAGCLAGAAAYGTVVVLAVRQEWASLPEWGWERWSRRALVPAALLPFGMIAVAWNEEMVFRGYGLDVLSKAVGRPAAIAILTWFFARFHGEGWQLLLGQGIAGLSFTLLRYASGGIWLPIGYHLMWNVTQLALIGPLDGMPSVRPMHVHGPYLWMGRPGHPEPGLLTVAVHVAGCMIAGYLWWRKRGKH